MAGPAIAPPRGTVAPAPARSAPNTTRAAGNAAGLSALANPNQALSGNALIQAARAMTQAEYQGPNAMLAQEIAQNNAQAAQATKATAGYFQQLGNFDQRAVANEAGISQGLNDQLSRIAASEQGQLGQIDQGANAMLARYTPPGEQASMAQSGALGDLNTQLAGQRGLASQSMAGFQGEGALQGANYRQLANAGLVSGAQLGRQDLQAIGRAAQSRDQTLALRQAAENQRYGPAFSKNLSALRQQQITDQVALGALGVKQANAQTARQRAQGQAKYQQGQLALGAQRNQLTAQRDASLASYQQARTALGWATLAQKNQQFNRTHGPGAVKPLPTVANDRMNTSLQQAYSYFWNAGQKGMNLGKVYHDYTAGLASRSYQSSTQSNSASGAHQSKTTHQSLIQSPGGVIATAAYQAATHQGRVSRATMTALQGMGMFNITLNGRPVLTY